MLRTAAVRILAMALLTAAPLHHGFAQDREKIEEGRYALLRSKGDISKTGHSWTLWRLPGGGYELEDRVDPEVTPRVPTFPTYGPSPRGVIRDFAMPSDFRVIYGPEWQILSLTVSGNNANHEHRDILKCRSDDTLVQCEGSDATAKLKLDSSRELFWWYRLPMLLRPWLRPAPGNAPALGPAKVAVLTFLAGPGVELTGYTQVWGSRPHLEAGDLIIASAGEALLPVGDQMVQTRKYSLDFRPQEGRSALFDCLDRCQWDHPCRSRHARAQHHGHAGGAQEVSRRRAFCPVATRAVRPTANVRQTRRPRARLHRAGAGDGRTCGPRAHRPPIRSPRPGSSMHARIRMTAE